MKIITNYGEYVAPEIVVNEIFSQEVLCTSSEQEEYAEGEWPW